MTCVPCASWAPAWVQSATGLLGSCGYGLHAALHRNSLHTGIYRPLLKLLYGRVYTALPCITHCSCNHLSRAACGGRGTYQLPEGLRGSFREARLSEKSLCIWVMGTSPATLLEIGAMYGNTQHPTPRVSYKMPQRPRSFLRELKES